VYAPQIVTAAQALAHYPCSKIIKENLEGRSLTLVYLIFIKVLSVFFFININVPICNLFLVFADMWQALTQDVSTVCKEIMEKQIPEKQTYMSLPRPGVS